MALTIRLTEEDKMLISELKRTKGYGSASKALIAAAKDSIKTLPILMNRVERLEKEKMEIEGRYRKLLSVARDRDLAENEFKEFYQRAINKLG